MPEALIHVSRDNRIALPFQNARQDERAPGAAGEYGERRVGRCPPGGVIEVGRLIQCGDLALVGEQDADTGADEIQELRPVAIDAEPVRQGEGDLAAGLAGDGHGLAEGGLGLGLVEQVALQVDNLGGFDEDRVDLAMVEAGLRAWLTGA